MEGLTPEQVEEQIDTMSEKLASVGARVFRTLPPRVPIAQVYFPGVNFHLNGIGKDANGMAPEDILGLLVKAYSLACPWESGG